MTDNNKGKNRGVIISEKTAPQPQDIQIVGHLSRAQQSGMIFQAKDKAQLEGPFNTIPYSRKYKWTRPVPPNNAQNTKSIIAEASNKRKNHSSSIAGPTKKVSVKGKEKEKEQVGVSFNSEGFYEVKVNYEHISKLAAGCGFNNSEVEEVIKTDNAQRQIQAANPTTTITTLSEEEQADLARFELDPNNELSSKGEGA